MSEPLHPHEVPLHSWHTVGSDVFFWEKQLYLMIVDYYSKYPVVKLLQDNSAESLIEAFSEVVALFGIPNKLITDHGTNYMSDRFKLFC